MAHRDTARPGWPDIVLTLLQRLIFGGMPHLLISPIGVRSAMRIAAYSCSRIYRSLVLFSGFETYRHRTLPTFRETEAEMLTVRQLLDRAIKALVVKQMILICCRYAMAVWTSFIPNCWAALAPSMRAIVDSATRASLSSLIASQALVVS